MAARTQITAIMIAVIVNQCGTKETGLGSPDIFPFILFKNDHLPEATLRSEKRKGTPKNSPKAMNRKTPLSSFLNARKAI